MKGIKGDFTGFTFGSVHSSELGLTRIINNGRITEDILPKLSDSTVQTPGSAGELYFGTNYTNKELTITFAFYDLTESELCKLSSFVNDKQPKDLIFDESPYKVCQARIAESVVIKHICYQNNNERRYSGEGELVFKGLSPYFRSRYEYIEDYTADLVLQWADRDDLSSLQLEGLTPLAVNSASIQYGFDEGYGSIRGDREDFEAWVTDGELLQPVEDSLEGILGSQQLPLSPDSQYFNLYEWLTSSGLPSRKQYGQWSKDGYTLFNAGDVPIPFEIFFKIPESGILDVKIILNEAVFDIKNLAAKIINTKKDIYIGISSKDYIIRGYNENFVFTGCTYNEYIKGGDFMFLQVGENQLQTTIAPATVKMHYLYL